jgi:FdhE protein
VAGGIFRKWLGQPGPLPPEVGEAVAELDRLAAERPALAGPAAVLRAVLPALYSEAVRETPPDLTPDQATAKFAGGIPLLRGETLNLDDSSFRRRWRAVCEAVRQHQGGEAPGKLAEALRRGGLDARELIQEVLAGRSEAVHARADVLGLDAGLTATVLRLTAFPVLSQVSAAWEHFRAAGRWGQGYCPTCGSWPLLGEFRGLEQLRFLRCGWCAAEWEFPRLLCPFCGTRDHQQLGYLTVEGEEAKARVAVCDACRGYVKMVTTLSALPGPRMLVADLATVHLDLTAAERGYLVPG